MFSFRRHSPKFLRTVHTDTPKRSRLKRPYVTYSASALLLAGGGITGFQLYNDRRDLRHAALAVMRCSRVADAAIRDAIDYKITLSTRYVSDEEQQTAYSNCHTRSATRVLNALMANGGIFIKLGQHLSSLIVLPVEWTRTMKPLQDQCTPTDIVHLDAMFTEDMGQSLEDMFAEFDPKPIGVASLAQVHIARLKTGQEVAVKLQHPHLAEFCEIDMKMVEFTFGWIKYLFPEFELTWLADEMRTNLPLEMNFVHEASNATRTMEEFKNIKTSLYIPKVLLAKPRILLMEYINGGRVDDIAYLAANHIDRNQVALELARIFAEMVFISGNFHADPHLGNLLLRPAPPLTSKSPFNFEIVLLDHGLYFDLDSENDNLRINYSKFWLSLIAPASEKTTADHDRRKYAQLVANIGPDLYPVFEAAITGRVALEGTWDNSSSPEERPSFNRASGMMDIEPQSEEEKVAIRNAVATREGLLQDVLDMLRRVPSRVLMLLKLNDLTRTLDHALMTTHSNTRIFLITSKYCFRAEWEDNRNRLINTMRTRGMLSLGILYEYFSCWWRYQRNYRGIVVVETYMDLKARSVITMAWFRGLWKHGLKGASLAAAGLEVV